MKKLSEGEWYIYDIFLDSRNLNFMGPDEPVITSRYLPEERYTEDEIGTRSKLPLKNLKPDAIIQGLIISNEIVLEKKVKFLGVNNKGSGIEIPKELLDLAISDGLIWLVFEYDDSDGGRLYIQSDFVYINEQTKIIS